MQRLERESLGHTILAHPVVLRVQPQAFNWLPGCYLIYLPTSLNTVTGIAKPPVNRLRNPGSAKVMASERGDSTAPQYLRLNPRFFPPHYSGLCQGGKQDCCSVTQSFLTSCDPMDCSTAGFPVLHYLLEFAQTHVHRVDDARGGRTHFPCQRTGQPEAVLPTSQSD